MAVLTETTPRIIIAGLSMDDYSVMDVALHKELLKPAELVFTMRKKSLLRNDGDICFEVAEQLIGSSVKLEIKTRRQDQGLEQKNETLAFSGIVFNAVCDGHSQHRYCYANHLSQLFLRSKEWFRQRRVHPQQ